MSRDKRKRPQSDSPREERSDPGEAEQEGEQLAGRTPSPPWYHRIERGDWICVGVLLLVTLVVFWEGIVDPANMIREDAAYVFHPYYEYAGAEVRAGRFPHWNPYVMCGIPFHAGLQPALLYPLRWPLFFLSFEYGYPLSLGVHFFLTGVILYAFLRKTLRCRPLPALIGSVSFTFGGFTLGHLSHPSRLQAYPWFVLTIFLLAEALSRVRWTWAVAAAVPFCLVFLTGDGNLPMMLAFGLGVWGLCDAIVHLVKRLRGADIGWGHVVFPLVAVGIVTGLGAALAMPQLLPALAQTKISSRAEVGWEFVVSQSAHPIQALVLLTAPFYWGNYRLGYWGSDFFHEPCIYAGALVLVLACAAVAATPRDRWVWRLAGLVVLMAVIGAGKYLPIYWVLYKVVPMFDKLRCPGRLYVWVDLGLACLAALGLQRLTDLTDSGIRRRATLAAGVMTGVVTLLVLGGLIRLAALADDPAPAVETLKQVEHLRPYEIKERAEAAQIMPGRLIYGPDVLTWLGIFAALGSCVIAVILLVKDRLRSTAGQGLLAGLLIVDMVVFSTGMINYSEFLHPVLHTPKHVRFLQEKLGDQRYLCMQSKEAPTSLHHGMLFGIRHVIAGGVGIYHTPRQEKAIGYFFRGSLPLLNLASVRYLVASRPIRGGPIRPVLQDDRTFVMENTQAFPRAFLVRQVRRVDDPEALIAEILKGKVNLAEIALVEEPVDPLPAPPSDEKVRGTVRDLDIEPSRFRMTVEAPGPRQLVVNEAHHPNWRCTVNGRPVPIRQTDWLFMSVRVPAGESEVLLWFEPDEFKRGLVVWAMAMLVVVGTLAYAILDGRRRRLT